MKAGIDEGASLIDTSDNVTDLMIILSDGFDSFNSAEVIAAANQVTSAGTTILSIGFGQNNFINFLQMMMVANMVQPNFFTAGSGSALMGLVDPILLQICAQGSSRSLGVNPYSVADPLEDIGYLYKAIGIYIDVYGKAPVWAESILRDYTGLPEWAVNALERYY